MKFSATTLIAFFAVNSGAATAANPSLRGLNSACGQGNFFVTNDEINTWYGIRQACECPGTDDDLQNLGNNWALTQQGLSYEGDDKVCIDGCANLACNSPVQRRGLNSACGQENFFVTNSDVNTWYKVRQACECPGTDDDLQNIGNNWALTQQGLSYDGDDKVCVDGCANLACDSPVSDRRGLNSACGQENFFVTNNKVNTWYKVRQACECPGTDDDLQNIGNNWALTQQGLSYDGDDKVCVDGCANLNCDSPVSDRRLQECPSGEYFETNSSVNTWYKVRDHCDCPGGDDTIQNIPANSELLAQGLDYEGGQQVCLPVGCNEC